MSRSKKMFVWATLAFLGLLFYASYDIARRTTFPGRKPQLKTRIQEAYFGKDSISTREIREDSLTQEKK
jgi:hypothetical protein